MNNKHKGKAKNILASTALALLIAVTLMPGYKMFALPGFYKNLTSDTVPKQKRILKPRPSVTKDSLQKLPAAQPAVVDTIPKPVADSVGLNRADTSNPVQVDTIYAKMSKDSLSAPVTYHADDSMVMDVPGKKIILYGKKSTTVYQDNNLEAPVIIFDQKTNLVTASLKKDSTGKVISFPTLKQGESKMVSDTIGFNMKNGKGITKGTYTQQGEMYIYGERMKKINTTDFYAFKGRFTTCNLDTPHFAFVSKKIKFRNNKFAITGPVHPEFEGVPIPIVLPFGIFPLAQGRHSGILAPTFTANDQFGLALEGLGYYKVLNDNWDITTRATLYSYGGFTFNVSPRYYKRYHYSGNFSFDYNRFKYNFKGDPDFSTNKAFNIRWTHSADTKSRPGVTFSANVNAGSSKFNSLVPNSPARNFQNQLSSSIAYARTWKDKPFNISINANHSQNTNNKTINVTLPDLTFNLQTLYPFRRKEPVGALKWYENIGVALNSNAKSQTYFSDDTSVSKLNIGKQIFNNLQWGATHNVPISLSLPQIGPLQISPGISYSEKWYQEQLHQDFDTIKNRIDSVRNKGFYAARDMAFSLSLSTRIFGSFTFGKNAAVQAIRHEIRPSVSISYKPDFNGKSYYNYFRDSAAILRRDTSRASLYSNSLYGAFGEGKFGGLSFNIDNNVQMKLRNKADTAAGATKKVTLIDGFSFNGSYNFLKDTLRFSTFSVSARTNLFNKINITTSATLDPYDIDPANGRTINKLLWTKKPTLGRLVSGSVSLSTQFQGGDQSKKKAPVQNNPNQMINQNTGMPLDEYETEMAYMSNNPAEFTDFSLPWSLSFSYSLQFSKVFQSAKIGFKKNLDQNINWNSTLKLTEKWQLGINGYYNITQKQLGTLSMSIAREMHCWQMSINISPVGKYRFFNISISPKSAILRDVKINRSRNFYQFP
ncbi:MAG: putative LPS assembly protein LptD [Ferruginibacter sp.]